MALCIVLKNLFENFISNNHVYFYLDDCCTKYDFSYYNPHSEQLQDS